MSNKITKVLGNTAFFRAISIAGSLFAAALTIGITLVAIFSMADFLHDVVTPSAQRGTSLAPALIGGVIIGWLALHYFFGYFYVGLLSKLGGSKRARLAKILTIVTTVAWGILFAAHALLIAVIIRLLMMLFLPVGDLVFIAGMFISLRAIQKKAAPLN